MSPPGYKPNFIKVNFLSSGKRGVSLQRKHGQFLHRHWTQKTKFAVSR